MFNLKKGLGIIVILLSLCSPAQADLSSKEAQAVVSFTHMHAMNTRPQMGEAATYEAEYRIHFAGSGAWIAPNYILTCSHILSERDQKAGTIMAVHIGDQDYPVSLVYIDRNKDIAIYKSNSYTSSIWLKISDNPQDDVVGTPTTAYGDFLADNGKLEYSNGQILNRQNTYQMMSSSVVRSGFSGGPVINSNTNEIIGVVQQRNAWGRNECIMLDRQNILYETQRLGIEYTKIPKKRK